MREGNSRWKKKRKIENSDCRWKIKKREGKKEKIVAKIKKNALKLGKKMNINVGRGDDRNAQYILCVQEVVTQII